MTRPRTFSGTLRLFRMRLNALVHAVAIEIRLDWCRARRFVQRLGIGVHRGDV